MAKYATAQQLDNEARDAEPAEHFSGPVIDLVHLSRQTLGDSALEGELLTLFDRQALQFSTRLGASMAAGEGKWRGDLAHTLKGSASAVGAFMVADAAAAYETAARAESPEAELAWRRLAAAIDRARGEIAGLL
ncbi:MAG: Hpt domain-containing protein [Methylocystis sp.]|jgi:HPt (histidine-containing phosphotransfer) domain-containing protein